MKSQFVLAIVTSFISFFLGTMFSPHVLPVLYTGKDNLMGCTAAASKARGTMDRLFAIVDENRDKTSEQLNELTRLGEQAYAHYQNASTCSTPLSADAMFSMAALHCTGVGVERKDIQKGIEMIDQAGRIPGASYGRVFNAILHCRQGDLKAMFNK